MIDKIKSVIPADRIIENVSMAEYTTFKVGGDASVFIIPQSTDELKSVIELFYELSQPYYVLGKGSNIIVNDRGIKRPVIYIGKALSGVEIFESYITAKGGASLSSIAQKALENSLTGFEFAAGIPGTFGGAIIMNAGAYEGEIKDVIEAVSYIDPTGKERVASNSEMEFSYRNSALMDTGCIITGGTISLKKGDRESIQAKMADLALRRRTKQPLEFPSAGSTFKRPEGYFAGKLIMDAGLRGYSIGGAKVSDKHCGFVINAGNATAADVAEVIQEVQEKVKEKFGVTLEKEVIFLGDF